MTPTEREPKITRPLPLLDHRAMAAYWGEETVWAIKGAIAEPLPKTIEDLYLDHAVRAGRMAWWHALKAVRG